MTTKLTADQVQEIRRMRARGAQLKYIAMQFGVSRSCISLIVGKHRWKDTAFLTCPHCKRPV